MMGKIFSYCYRALFILFVSAFLISGCEKDIDNPDDDGTDTIDKPTDTPYDIRLIKDTYGEISSPDMKSKWGPYNVHDPSIIKHNDYFYCFNTDVCYGHDVAPGIQVRKSKDLVKWSYVGTVFDGLPVQGAEYIRSRGIEPFNSLWAPYVMKVGDEIRCYYSLSSSVHRTSCIGLATATKILGPWTEKGLAVKSSDNWSITQTNAIDPSVLVDKAGRFWMYYGSAYDGIYVLELDPTTGLALKPGDIGKRIAQRGFTNGTVNGNIEGPEIIYNAEFDKYFLFLAYDWLQTKYNVRVGRADSPEGPFLDFNGEDMCLEKDNIPMIVAPYRFNGHSGWQGVSHCSVFKEGDKYFIAHQGRPGIDSYYMILHVRELFWTPEGWPVASPERYAAVDQFPVLENEIPGDWQHIVFNYKVVPGYADEQLSPDFQVAEKITLDAAGTINNSTSDTWSFNSPWLELKWSNGIVEKSRVIRGLDWESNADSCILFTGIDQNGKTYWGKK